MDILDHEEDENERSFPRLTIASLIACIIVEAIRLSAIIFLDGLMVKNHPTFFTVLYVILLPISLTGLILAIASLVKNSGFRTITIIGVVLNSIYIFQEVRTIYLFYLKGIFF